MNREELKVITKLESSKYTYLCTEPLYLKSKVDHLLDEKDAEIEDLLRQNRELCQALQVMYSKEEYGKLQKEIESLKATHDTEMMDAGMRERRLRRALYKACANWADVEVFERTVGIDDPNVEANRWALMRNKCLKKSEEYK